MTKAKVVYYKGDEVVKVERGNYSDGSYNGRYGMRSIFEYDAAELLITPERCDFNRIELYKRNRAGVSRRLVARVERG